MRIVCFLVFVLLPHFVFAQSSIDNPMTSLDGNSSCLFFAFNRANSNRLDGLMGRAEYVYPNPWDQSVAHVWNAFDPGSSKSRVGLRGKWERKKDKKRGTA
jgi:hypothetical protein